MHGGDSGAQVHVDPHVMCTPAIGDIDADGAMDLVVPVTYLFDRAYYDSEEHRAELPADLDLSLYVASGVVAFDLARRSVKWTRHLDLTTDHVSLRCALPHACMRCPRAPGGVMSACQGRCTACACMCRVRRRACTRAPRSWTLMHAHHAARTCTRAPPSQTWTTMGIWRS
jgi:hypothetical protein